MTNRILGVIGVALACVAASATPAHAMLALPHNPIGHVDKLVIDDTKYDVVWATGWAGDFDAGSAPGQRVHLYVDGRGAAAASTGVSRPDVYRVFPVLGRNTGYYIAATRPPGRGTHTACLYAINRGPGGTTRLACKPFTVEFPGRIIGHIDSFTVDPNNPALRVVRGWVLDPYDAVSPTPFGIKWVSGPRTPAPVSNGFPSYITGSAGLPRPDVDAVYPKNGHNHGFAITFNPGSEYVDWAAGSKVCLGTIAYNWPDIGVYETSYCATFPG